MMRESPESRLAFSETCDPAAYVPRPATDYALAQIDDWDAELRAGAGLAVLVSQPGLGKTFLLRRVEADRRDDEAVFTSVASLAAMRPSLHESWALYLPHAGLGPSDLCRWVYGLLGRRLDPSRVADPEAAFAGLCALGSGARGPLLLLLDDADSMPPETIEMFLRGLISGSAPLRVLLALDEGPRATRLLAALHDLRPREIEYRGRLTVHETAAYVRGRMRWAGFSEATVQAVDGRTVERIHAHSGGIPIRIHRVAARILMGRSDEDARRIGRSPRGDDWLGEPIEDEFPP